MTAYCRVVDFVRPVQAVIPGVQGRVLAVLAETTADLNLTTLARLAGVSVAQTSRVMPDLVGLGLVARREVPPSAQFRLVREHVAAEAVLALAGARASVLRRIGEAASQINPQPASVVLFGSFARSEADSDSDIDVVAVRADGVDEDDEAWWSSLDRWRRRVVTITGNRVELLEISTSEAGRKLRGKSELWRNIRDDGVVVYGAELSALVKTVDA